MNTNMGFEKVFLGGSKATGHIPDQVAAFLELFLSENAHFLVGDCHGADLAIQTYLHSKGYRNVTVYCSGDKCRFNVGNWDVEHISAATNDIGYSFYQAKDLAMIRGCDAALFVWDSRSRGTKNNIRALRRAGKPVFIYRTDSERLHIIRVAMKNPTPEERALMETEEYRQYGYRIVDCPVCGHKTLDSFWICTYCGWEYDELTEQGYSACNGATLEEYRERYRNRNT